MTVSKNAAWTAGTAALAVLVLLATWYLFVLPERAEAADLAAQRVAVQQQNAAIAAKTSLLESQFATLDEKRAELAAIRATLPPDTELPQLLRQLDGYAEAAGVDLTSIAPGTPAPFSGGSTAADPAAAAASGVLAIPLQLTVTGSFAGAELFLRNVQADMQRFLLVEGVDLAAGATGPAGGVTTTITGKVFVLRNTTAAPAAATPIPAGTTTEAVS